MNLLIMRKNLKRIHEFRVNLIRKMKAKLEGELSSLEARCTKINEVRKFNQVRELKAGITEGLIG